MKNDVRIGYLNLFSAATVYGTYGIFSRLISDSFLPFTQNYIRDGISIVIVLLLFLLGIIKWEKDTKS
jgi:drug/metabolite transporter (DMT)-like permease